MHPHNYEPEVGFQAYDPQGEVIAATSNFADLPAPTTEERGFRDIEREGKRWRTFTLQNRANLVIRIGEQSDNRVDIARGLVIEHTLPLLIGLPLLALLVSLAVKRGLRPVAVLTEMLDRRTPGSRKPMPADVAPGEIKPLIVALNQQLERLEDALDREHRFATDVAHELRTPLAATMIHLESAMDTGSCWRHEVALTAMFRNLIENALRYTESEGQVDVSVRREGGHGRHHLRQRPGHSRGSARRCFSVSIARWRARARVWPGLEHRAASDRVA